MPRAYLNVMFFNERFEFVQEGSAALRVSQPGDNAAPLVLSNIKAPKNGYAYIYLSNENDDPVYWDDFTVSYTRGKIIEENHYYAFGLRISGISSRKYDGGLEGSLKNGYLYNDKELWDDADLDWYDYGFRNYDAQIGRFTQLDPLTWDYPELTNYQYASNEPIANVDMDGLEAVGSTVASSVGDAVVTSASFMDNIVVTGLKHAAPVVSKASTVTTRIFGGLKAVGGILEAGVGAVAGTATSWTGVGAVAGGFVVAHGADVAASGLNQLIFGRETKSFAEQGISKGLQGAGMSKEKADDWAGNADAGISIFGSGWAGGGLLRGTVSRSATGAVGASVAAKGGTSLVQANRTAGNLFRDELAAALRAEGRTVNTEVFKRTPFGKRYMDLDVWHNGVNLGGIETKVGGSRYLPLQRLKDAWLGANGYPVQLVRKPTNW